MTGKISDKQFYHLMSAMLFIPDWFEKERMVRRLHDAYTGQREPDPVVWARRYFATRPDKNDGVYIRKTFEAQCYSELTGKSEE